jgi:biotin carboxyl carrier protein
MRLYLDDQGFDAPLHSEDIPGDVLITQDGEVVVFDAGETFVLTPRPPIKDAAHAGGGDGSVRAPMPGKVVAIAVSVGDKVTRGQPLLTLEAMKMEHALTAPFDGEVEAISVSVGDQVSEGVSLARLAAAKDA